MGQDTVEIPSRSVRVLVVDDDESQRAMVQHILKDPQFRLTFASDGSRALSLLEHGFDVVLLDYRMPGMDGIEVLRAIRGRGPGPAIILMTAQGTEATALAALSQGAVDYIVKDREMAPNLLAAIETAIDSRASIATASPQTQSVDGRVIRAAMEDIRLDGPLRGVLVVDASGGVLGAQLPLGMDAGVTARGALALWAATKSFESMRGVKAESAMARFGDFGALVEPLHGPALLLVLVSPADAMTQARIQWSRIAMRLEAAWKARP